MGDNLSLLSKAALHVPNPTSLSILEYIEMTSRKTNKVPLGKWRKTTINPSYTKGVKSMLLRFFFDNFG